MHRDYGPARQNPPTQAVPLHWIIPTFVIDNFASSKLKQKFVSFERIEQSSSPMTMFTWPQIFSPVLMQVAQSKTMTITAISQHCKITSMR